MKNREQKKLANLERRRADYDRLSSDQQRKRKRPGSRKK